MLVRCCTVTCCRCVANPRREETRAAACCSFVRLGPCRGLLFDLRVCLCGAVGVVTRVKTACCSAGLGFVGCVRCSARLVLLGASSRAVTFLRLASAARTRDPAVFFLRCGLFLSADHIGNSNLFYVRLASAITPPDICVHVPTSCTARRLYGRPGVFASLPLTLCLFSCTLSPSALVHQRHGAAVDVPDGCGGGRGRRCSSPIDGTGPRLLPSLRPGLPHGHEGEDAAGQERPSLPRQVGAAKRHHVWWYHYFTTVRFMSRELTGGRQARRVRGGWQFMGRERRCGRQAKHKARLVENRSVMNRQHKRVWWFIESRAQAYWRLIGTKGSSPLAGNWTMARVICQHSWGLKACACGQRRCPVLRSTLR